MKLLLFLGKTSKLSNSHTLLSTGAGGSMSSSSSSSSSLASFEAPLSVDHDDELLGSPPKKLKPLYEAAMPNPLQDIKLLLASVLHYNPTKSFSQVLGPSHQLTSVASKLLLKEAFDQVKSETRMSRRILSARGPRSHNRHQIVYVSTQWQCVVCGRLFHGDRRSTIAFCPACGVPPTLDDAQRALCFAIEAYQAGKPTSPISLEPLSNSSDEPPLLSSPEHVAPPSPEESLLSGGLIEEIQYYLAHELH